MRLTTKGRYAVTAMLDLALHKSGNPVTLSGISDRQGISLSYLEQLFAKLRKKGLVSSTRGPGGGYRLATEASLISISKIIKAVDETVDATRCGGMGNCQDDHQCLTHELWCDLSGQIQSFLDGITLDDLINRENVQQVYEVQRQEQPAIKLEVG